MPTRRAIVKSGKESEFYRDFADMSLADRHTQGRSYRAAEHFSSSEPEREFRQPGRSYRDPVEPSYYGPHFEKGPAQEKLWDDRKSKEVWNPYQPTRSVAARPETHGRAHSIHQSRMDQPRLSDPYEKRPMPYKDRTLADYDTYKDPCESFGAIATEMKSYKHTQVGRNVYPEDSHREALLKGKELTSTGRYMANLAGQSRMGFSQKYPQAYEDTTRIDTHAQEAFNTRASAKKFRKGERDIDGNLKAWERQRERQGRR